MRIHAVSIGEAVPRGNFDALIQSVFDSAVNLRLMHEDRLITLLISEGYELPQGIRVWGREVPLRSLDPGLCAASRGGILRFDSSPLTVDMRGASVWKCRVPELSLEMDSPSAQDAWANAWDLLNKEQRLKKTDMIADDLFQSDSGSTLSRRMREPVLGLVTSTGQFDPQGAIHAAEKMIGLGPGVTPSGDDILIGFLCALWSVSRENPMQSSFIHSFSGALMQIAKRTNEISRTYLYHAAQGQFYSSLTSLAEAFANGGDVAGTARAAMRVGHSSGMDSVTGMLLGLRVWSTTFPSLRPSDTPLPQGEGQG